MDIWSISESRFDPEAIVTNGNRYLMANGYLGYRGTMEEWGAAELAAVNLAGVYDQNGDKWREPVNAPNGLYLRVCVDGEPMVLGKTEVLSHSQQLDYRHGIFSRTTAFPAVTLETRRFASMANCHLLADRIILHFARDCCAEITTGIPNEIWDINGPHLFDRTRTAGHILLETSHTGQLNIPLAVGQAVSLDFPADEERISGEDGVFRKIRINAKAGDTCTLDLFAAVYSGLDGGEPAEQAVTLCETAAKSGFDACMDAHTQAWEAIWNTCGVALTGDEEAARAINASLYHLNCIAPRHADALSVPARGLSGQTYKGAIFWDSEIFIFPVFVHTQPELAKSLLRYRIETLNGARKKAAEYGYRGAFYAWESQEGGAEGCTNYNVTDVFTHRPVRTYFRDKQIHISGDIAYALWRYYEITGDPDLLMEGGAEVILECARFYLTRAYKKLDSEWIELTDVIGPDEYHERVSNNAFTNQIAAGCMEAALALETVYLGEPGAWNDLLDRLCYRKDWALLKAYAEKIVPPNRLNGIIEQFDGYFGLEDCSLAEVRSRLLDPREYWGTNRGVAAHTQIIKQADVIAMMVLFPQLFTDDEVRTNWEFYEPRTEHGSSLSACMYAIAACRIHRPDLAWEHFMKSAAIDVTGSGKQWAGEIYIGGTHPAANGGAWMIAVQGFAGLRVENGEISLNPNLPEQITSMTFPITVGGKQFRITVNHDGWEKEEILK